MIYEKTAENRILGSITASDRSLAAGGTLAYLTDKDSVTNQFVVGKVDIEGNEPSYAPDPDGKTNHIVPTQVIPKDPRIKIKVKMILTSIWMFPYQSQK